jgi:hypothetical protein
MNSPLKEALKRRRGKSIDLTIMIGPGDEAQPAKEADPKEGLIAEDEGLEREEISEEESPEQEAMEEVSEGDESDDGTEDVIGSMSDREKKRLMEEEPKTLMEKVKRLALMRGQKL